MTSVSDIPSWARWRNWQGKRSNNESIWKVKAVAVPPKHSSIPCNITTTSTCATQECLCPTEEFVCAKKIKVAVIHKDLNVFLIGTEHITKYKNWHSIFVRVTEWLHYKLIWLPGNYNVVITGKTQVENQLSTTTWAYVNSSLTSHICVSNTAAVHRMQ